MNNSSKFYPLILSGLASLLFCACGEESVSGTNDSIQSSALEGVYRVQSWVVSEGDCSLAGVAKTYLSDSLALLQMESWGGVSTLKTKSCASTAGCDSLLAGTRSWWSWGQTLDAGSDAAGYTGTTLSAGEIFGAGVCRGSVAKNTVTVGAGNVLTIEVRTTVADTFNMNSKGFCMTNDAATAAQGNACSQKDVIVLAPVQ